VAQFEITFHGYFVTLSVSHNPCLNTIKHAILRLSNTKEFTLTNYWYASFGTGGKTSCKRTFLEPSLHLMSSAIRFHAHLTPTYVYKESGACLSISSRIVTFVNKTGLFRNQEMAMMKVRNYCLYYSNNTWKKSVLSRPVPNVFSGVDAIYCNIIVNTNIN
jgi:hypothetical protein